MRHGGVWRTSLWLIAGALSFGTASASTVQVVFSGGGYGGTSNALAADAAGNLYGESQPDYDELFELPASSGYSQEIGLYTFSFSVPAGSWPDGGVTLTHDGSLLVETLQAGQDGLGAVVDLGTPEAIAPVVLHSFYANNMKPTDGYYPTSGLTLGPSNKYVGTTEYGGDSAPGKPTNGTIYEVRASTADSKYHVIHRFGNGLDGVHPTAGRLAIDVSKRLYGMTNQGGSYRQGTIFMVQFADGAWQEQVLYNFGAPGDLERPTANLVIDSQGNLYGCAQGGKNLQGGIFELSPPLQAGAAWQESILYSFGDQPDDPNPAGSKVLENGKIHFGSSGCGIALDPTSNAIIGTSYAGGTDSRGTIFELNPPATGKTGWMETVAYNFTLRGNAGYHPVGAPLRVGKVYYGGVASNSAIYAFTP